ncbi:hypothetical protein L6452_21898 [Arctium lappa]|uniref:Uncharacterized protein n=1 Tax=Arctium lappa TaxID=4217 RepID=A0ACB9AYC2_ARCLA|nr:hypothetical protein L6452_21898 [Arctium lappa]
MDDSKPRHIRKKSVAYSCSGHAKDSNSQWDLIGRSEISWDACDRVIPIEYKWINTSFLPLSKQCPSCSRIGIEIAVRGIPDLLSRVDREGGTGKKVEKVTRMGHVKEAVDKKGWQMEVVVIGLDLG